ncbi:MerR family transcriptional regulator [Paenibacillus sp. GP183]|jgi:DNA-binding transcriptional MerR regulator|uniref:MerR family transcriptional regulator n=1 Tax=Paenibacillus sp. GP183 TaxID=1882751 RepID=UPI00089D97A5|nr:MerR family transcriptional regulator [Paenibacillus sp. GP183]SEC66767.1 DNA-binding transcriptional regulator, MerR family [Paenibacillus sp. GP183]
MRIGELAQETGVSIRSLRYYEAKHLIVSDREENGYRIYNKTAVERVKTIQFYLSLGFNTDEIENFLNCVMVSREAFCEQILPMYEQKLQVIDKQLHQLNQVRSNLLERIEFIKEDQKQQVPLHTSER